MMRSRIEEVDRNFEYLEMSIFVCMACCYFGSFVSFFMDKILIMICEHAS